MCSLDTSSNVELGIPRTVHYRSFMIISYCQAPTMWDT